MNGLTIIALCPWHGLCCECGRFPFLKNGIIPQECEDTMPEEILGYRKVSEEGKRRYQVYLAEIEANRKKTKK